MEKQNINLSTENRLCVIGLGYVGLPIAVSFSKYFEVIGFDISETRISELRNGIDRTRELTSCQLNALENINFTSNAENISASNVYIVTVPTPIKSDKSPDLAHILSATELIAKNITKGDLIIYESTVYPGVTEDICAKRIEELTGFNLNSDFYVGYSPERINPGDKINTLENIVKVVSGSTPEIEDRIAQLYATVVTAGIHVAASIKVAEAAKVIENTQRDLNIALMNELALIFDRLEIDTDAVLRAAGTKWNFLPFKPGLVGGHCIGVDPYYLTYKAQEVGYLPEVILAGRRINDNMAKFIAKSAIKTLLNKSISVNQDTRILILGFTFKENCPDIRNTKVYDLYMELLDYNVIVDVYDPEADKKELKKEYSIETLDYPASAVYDAIIFAVPHNEFISLGIDTISSWAKPNHIFMDLKSVFEKDKSDWRL